MAQDWELRVEGVIAKPVEPDVTEGFLAANFRNPVRDMGYFYWVGHRLGRQEAVGEVETITPQNID